MSTGIPPLDPAHFYTSNSNTQQPRYHQQTGFGSSYRYDTVPYPSTNDLYRTEEGYPAPPNLAYPQPQLQDHSYPSYQPEIRYETQGYLTHQAKQYTYPHPECAKFHDTTTPPALAASASTIPPYPQPQQVFSNQPPHFDPRQVQHFATEVRPTSQLESGYQSIKPKTNPLPSVAPLKVKLIVKGPPAPTAPAFNTALTMSRRRSNPDPEPSGRSLRQSRSHPRVSYVVDNDPSDIDDEEAHYRPQHHPPHHLEREPQPEPEPERHTRSGRSSKMPDRYVPDQIVVQGNRNRNRFAGKDDFEERMVETSPVLHDLPGRASGSGSGSRGGRVKREFIDPDEEDGVEEEEYVESRRAFPPRVTRTSINSNHNELYDPPPATRPTRSTRTVKSRHSSAEDQQSLCNPSDNDDDMGDPTPSPSEDPLVENYGEDSYTSHSPTPPPRQRQRQLKARPPPSRRQPTRQSQGRGSGRGRGRVDPDGDGDGDSDEDDIPRKRQLRERKAAVNYRLPPLDISAELVQDAIQLAARPNGRGLGGGRKVGGASTGAGPGGAGGWGVRGRDLARAMGDMDSSDSEFDFLQAQPTNPNSGGQSNLPAPLGGRGGASTDIINYGRVNPKSSTADADPLGVSMDIGFGSVGGLDGHINQLKEMVALPLLYPELFQQFRITPPRGVLFHGPPGTGKTLLARALAGSCSNGNTKISFFMRKGADVLSKWVGEAERQLRMLFEEARASQPSIIFFDEIDGLAPVRSSKQDQIHASLVSTLLALMDGMDGRGQVIVIGATNRPDAVDPALRRPGRFDREFYFPLPNKDARKKIIEINTKEWDPPLSAEMVEKLGGMTKGYGGADLRALCTEAAINAIQRRYPQIYKTTDRLLLNPGSIKVEAKDFMISIKKITPSSARSTASPAVPLPEHLTPLLSGSLTRLKDAVNKILPEKKKITALEEAEFEDDGLGFDGEMLIQNAEKLRTYRPRLLIHGPAGMGQAYLGPALLHHLEGFHVQSLDLAGLMGDSTRTVEAGLVQQFIEAKRHQPSILFIPSLSAWSTTLTDQARSTFRALLDSVPPSDPVLLLALSDDVGDLPKDVRAWFGLGDEGRIGLPSPTAGERAEYFAPLLETLRKPPSDFPDALPRRKRVLEDLPLAPPLPPRVPTEADLARELERDSSARNMMVISFTGLIQEFLKKYRKVVGSVRDDALEVSQWLADDAALNAVPTAIPTESDDPVVPLPGISLEAESVPNGHERRLSIPEITISSSAPAVLPRPTTPILNGHGDPPQVPIIPKPTWQAHDVTIDTLQRRLVRYKYLTPQDFLDDVAKIEDNAAHLNDPERQAKVAEMGANARLHVAGFDGKWMPEFERYAERVRLRKAEREKEKDREKGKEADVGVGLVVGGEIEMGADGESGEGSGLKRPREEDEYQNGREKRAREDLMDIDQVQAPTISSNLTVNISNSDPTVPPPRKEYPPFILSQAQLSTLTNALQHSTTQLNVDQLEQLRAGCYDIIWRRRGEWDRGEAVRGVRELVGRFVKEVAELEDGDE